MKALGMIETKGLSCALESLDAMLKTAEVGYVGQKRVGSGFVTILVDGDVASNQLNWQWTAGTGTDANPHRILNPTRQSQRFDASGAYIRRWVTELANLPPALIHDPPADVRRRCGYPLPIVDHHEAVAVFRARRAS